MRSNKDERLTALCIPDSDETSLQTCDKALQPDYTITFCPDADTEITPPPSQDPSYAASNVCVPVSRSTISIHYVLKHDYSVIRRVTGWNQEAET